MNTKKLVPNFLLHCVVRGSLDDMSLSPKRHLDRFSRFARLTGVPVLNIQPVDRQTTKRRTLCSNRPHLRDVGPRSRVLHEVHIGAPPGKYYRSIHKLEDRGSFNSSNVTDVQRRNRFRSTSAPPTSVTSQLDDVTTTTFLHGTKVCRYNWHSAGSPGRPFPTLKYT